ncbi:MAG: sigma-54-dependent Fis family transcriptional regulator [Burkholderiales bacterium]|jgi:two-component system response regulator PilR (NtrC family)|nr:sigma-54-dependent Fis family transcriptional regulator [Burkholderiales bacterium]
MSTAPPTRLLVVDDEPDLRTLYELTLLREGYEIDSAGSVAEALAHLQANQYSAVITDMKLPDGSGLALLRWLEQAGRPEKALVITAFGSAENAVEALKAGAYDYLTKPVDLRQFRLVVGSAVGRVAAEPAPKTVAEDTVAAATALRLVGESPAIRAVRSLIDKVARSMAPVLVQGESGTGKELVARAIHDHGVRPEGRFVAVNCGAIPENLLEAEFFGYRKGAFTGANEDREGFFQAADGGTLFLDEIGDLPLAMQSKLLRVIQERSVRPVGATAETPINVRILSATHKDLGAEVAGGRFRQDLFYRLNVIQIRVPPLRERLEDLGLISNRVLARIAQDAGVSPTPRLTAGALQTLSRYAFPGNVRELENLLHRALALAGGEWIDADDLGLPDALLDEGRSESQFAALVTPVDVAPVAEGLSLPEQLPSDLARYLDEVERAILLRALELHRFNRTAAAASLGLSLRQIRYRMARLAISAGDS